MVNTKNLTVVGKMDFSHLFQLKMMFHIEENKLTEDTVPAKQC